MHQTDMNPVAWSESAARYKLTRMNDLQFPSTPELAGNLPGEWFQACQHVQCGLAIVDGSSETYLAVNDAFARERGYRDDELVGTSMWALHPPEHHVALRRQLQRELDATGRALIRSEHITRDGCRLPVRLDITVIVNRGGGRLRLVYSQATAHPEHVPSALRNEQRLFHALVDASPAAMLLTDVDGRITLEALTRIELYR
jgi:PAS domain S-box-containing protein